MPDQPAFYVPVVALLPCPQCNQAMVYCCQACNGSVQNPSHPHDTRDGQCQTELQKCCSHAQLDNHEGPLGRECPPAATFSDAYQNLRGAFNIADQWQRFSDFVYLRSHNMTELNITYVYDNEIGDYRRFGSSSDWQHVLDHMEDFHIGFVLIDLSAEQAFLLRPRVRSAKLEPRAALDYLLAEPTAVGYMSRGPYEDREFVYIETCATAEQCDLGMNRKRFMRRDKLQMALIRLFRGVMSWRT